ncbi:MAG: hypothetical protein V5A61_15300 [Haloarculaceae archaeon]
MFPDDAEFSTGLDLALLGTLLLIVAGVAREVASSPVAPEMGLLEPVDAGVGPAVTPSRPTRSGRDSRSSRCS